MMYLCGELCACLPYSRSVAVHDGANIWVFTAREKPPTYLSTYVVTYLTYDLGPQQQRCVVCNSIPEKSM